MDEPLNEYLWQGTGPVDDLVRELERLLAPFRHDATETPLSLDGPPPPDADRSS